MGRKAVEACWCILRTAGPRTLPLAASLAKAGLEVWTPVCTQSRRRHRSGKAKSDIDVPITPTFVFARADHLLDLARIIADPVSPHLAFSVFKCGGQIGLVHESEIARLRKAEERAKRERLKSTRIAFAAGASVRTSEGGFAGLTGLVTGGDDKFAIVNFGGGFTVKIATWLLSENDIATDAAHRSTAALAA